jgi:hypothetical protein
MNTLEQAKTTEEITAYMINALEYLLKTLRDAIADDLQVARIRVTSCGLAGLSEKINEKLKSLKDE